MAVATELQAGPEMNAEIARRLFGFSVETRPCEHNPCFNCGRPHTYYYDPEIGWLSTFSYSTDIAAAWLVVEKMRETGWHHFGLESYRPGEPMVYRWIACFGGTHHVDAYGIPEGPDAREHRCEESDTAPLAICRAAIQALATTQDQQA